MIDPEEQHCVAAGSRHSLTVSSDGFAPGENHSAERPFAHAEPGELMAWLLATASFPTAGSGGSRGLDDYFVRDFSPNIGAEIMGRNTSVRSAIPGRTTNGRAGGATSRRSTPPSSS